MGAATFTQENFLGGQWSQTAQGRIDEPAYRQAMNVCLNGLAVEEGAWIRRSGTSFAAHTRQGNAGRILTYDFQQNAPYLVELTSGFARFYQGAAPAFTNDAQTVLSISTANPAIVGTKTAHGWLTGATVMFSGLGVNNPLLQNRQFTITVTDTTHFSIADALTGAAINGAILGVFVSGTVSRILELASLFHSATLGTVRLVQTSDAAILVSGTVPSQVLSVVSPPVPGVSFANFSFGPANFIDGPYLEPSVSGVTVTPSALTGNIQLGLGFSAWVSTKVYTAGQYVVFNGVAYVSLVDHNIGNTPPGTAWQATSPASVFGAGGLTSADIGRHVRLFSEPPLWAVGGSFTAGLVYKYNNAYWVCLVSNTGSAQNGPGVSVANWGLYPTGAIWTWGKITSLLNFLNLSALTKLGNMSNIAAAFNLIYNQPSANGAFTTQTSSTSFFQHKPNFASVDVTQPLTYIGVQFNSAQIVQTATVFAPTDVGIFFGRGQQSLNGYSYNCNVSVNSCVASLYAANVNLSNPATGTFLGSAAVAGMAGWGTISAGTYSLIINNTGAPTTAFLYYWVVFSAFAAANSAFANQVTASIAIYVSQLTFTQPPSLSSGASGMNIDILGPDLLWSNPITTWRLGLFRPGGISGWPTCGTYHEGRLWLAGAVPNRFDASQPNQPWASQISFSPTLFDTGTVTASSALNYTLNADTTNSILWMKSVQEGIIMGTEHNEWLVQATTLSDPLTPTNIQAHPTTKIGSSLAPTAEAIQCEHTTVFLQRFSRRLMEYFHDVFSGKYSAPNLSEKAADLVGPQLDTLVYQHSLSPVIWARRTDGVLVGCSYKRESLFSSQGPKFIAWHQHSLGTGRTVTSIAAASIDGTSDNLAMTTLDSSTGIYFVEVMNNFFQESDLLSSAKFLDASMVPTSTLSSGAVFVLNGLWPLNGKTVTAFIGGLDCGDYVVANGTISVPFTTSNPLFTADFVNTYSGTLPILVGATYTSQGQLVAPKSPADSGARGGPAPGKIQRIHRFAAKLVNTLGISFGTNFTHLHPAQFQSLGGIPFAINTLFTGTYRSTIEDNYSLDARLSWQISRPFPATIANISGAIHTQDL